MRINYKNDNQINILYKKNLVVLTGAGMSAESGIATFRDKDGLWEGHNVMEVASPQGWRANPSLVLNFYNQRRRQLLNVKPNAAHFALAELEGKYKVSIITQNVDDLHERAGSSNIIHLHGELLKSRSSKYENLVYIQIEDINLGDYCEKGYQLRPHIVWFDEMVPMLEIAANICANADIVIVIGSSMQVYPAAGLVGNVPKDIPIYYIDPNPTKNYEMNQLKNLTVIAKKATEGMKGLLEIL